ncbi:unnamed protein product [Spirodela intermedia]|uniref:Uncharacterized protein n=1 Tax=Spirodela intermedia TaxID=51605 RepID=A0A7I8JUJ4_SPIIN|nr:unnamed protein product [Spirodela intermedia]CAA6673401.1 unnamed protein product [Spirodela intermedia]
MLEEVISPKGFITRSLLWEDATSHCHWANNSSKRRKNILGSCLQNSLLPVVSLGLTSDSGNLPTSEPKSRKSTRKTRKKGKQNGWPLYYRDHSDSVESSSIPGDFPPEVSICTQPAIDRCSIRLCDISRVEKNPETAISTSSRSISTRALMVDQVLDHCNIGNAACSGVNDETGSVYSRGEDEAASTFQKSTAPQCASPFVGATNRSQVSSKSCSSGAANASPSVKRDRCSRKTAASSSGALRPSRGGEYWRTRKEVNHAVWKRVQRNKPDEETTDECKYADSDCMGKGEVASDSATSVADLARIPSKFGGKLMSITPDKSTPGQGHKQSSGNGSRKGNTEKSTHPPSKSNSIYEVGCFSAPESYPQISDDISSSESSVLQVRERTSAEETHLPNKETSGWRPGAARGSQWFPVGQGDDDPSKARLTDSLTFDRSTTENDESSSETDLDEIIRAVEEGWRLETAPEALHRMAGRPLTEFERFLHSATPDLGQLSDVNVLEPGNEILGQRPIPNFPLRSLWQWYQRPGNYGLEVKVDGRPMTPPRSDGDRSNFRAYFVPYLSAVQLIGRSSSGGSPQVGHSPIFSVLLPSPRKKATDPAVDSCNVLFEYFESDPPQLRPPLYQKIKELLGGGASSDPRMSGDPSKLERLNLHDLHSGSWFSVAWYPIYRIPDGALRAAFLTFHSLGVFASGTSSRVVISPVVGLLSYNAKGEGWFRGVTEERLRVLERTASLIARSTVPATSGGNRHHPDYEFFTHRR